MQKYFYVQSKFIFEYESIFMCNINLFLNARVLLYAIKLYFCMPEYFYVQSKFIFECPSVFTCTFMG